MDEIFSECDKHLEREKRKKIVDPLAEKQRLKDSKQSSKTV
jgi:hypothetical protein